MAWAPDYLLRADLKAYVRITDTDDDDQIDLAITAASRAVDTSCSGAVERQFGKVDAPEERVYTLYSYYDSDRRLYVYEIDDFMDGNVLSVTADGTVTTDYTLEPRNAPKRGMPYTRIAVLACESVAVSGSPGWNAFPTTIEQATLLQGSRFFSRRTSPYGISGSPDTGPGELRLLSRVDPDVAVMLTRYRRTGGTG